MRITLHKLWPHLFVWLEQLFKNISNSLEVIDVKERVFAPKEITQYHTINVTF